MDLKQVIQLGEATANAAVQAVLQQREANAQQPQSHEIPSQDDSASQEQEKQRSRKTTIPFSPIYEAVLHLETAGLIETEPNFSAGDPISSIAVVLAALRHLARELPRQATTHGFKSWSKRFPTDDEILPAAEVVYSRLQRLKYDSTNASIFSNADVVMAALASGLYELQDFADGTKRSGTYNLHWGLSTIWKADPVPSPVAWWIRFAGDAIRVNLLNLCGFMNATFRTWIIEYKFDEGNEVDTATYLLQRMIIGDCPCQYSDRMSTQKKCWNRHNLFGFIRNLSHPKPLNLRSYLYYSITGSLISVWERKAPPGTSPEVAVEVDRFRPNSIPSGLYCTWYNEHDGDFLLKILPRVSLESITTTSAGERIEIYTPAQKWLMLVPKDGDLRGHYWRRIAGQFCDECKHFIHRPNLGEMLTTCLKCSAPTLRTHRLAHSYVLDKTKIPESTGRSI